MTATSGGPAGSDARFEDRIETAGHGSRNELGQLLEECRHYLLWIARHAMGPGLQAKVGASDVVQETFLEAQVHFGQFRGRTRHDLQAWLRRILIARLANTCRTYLATDKRALSREVPLSAIRLSQGREVEVPFHRTCSPSGQAIQSELSQALDQGLGRLQERLRSAVLLKHQDHLTFQDIGRRLDCSAEAARKLYCRGIHQLQRELKSLS